MDSSRLLKKPKLEDDAIELNGDGDKARPGANSNSGDASRSGNDGESLREQEQEQEEALVALVEHRTKECQILRKKLEDAEKRLSDTKAKLARVRLRSKPSPSAATVVVKEEGRSSSPARKDRNNQEYAQNRPTWGQQSSRPQLVLPPLNTKPSTMAADARGGRSTKSELKTSPGAGNRTNSSSSVQPNVSEKSKSFPEKGASVGSQEKKIKRKLEHKEHQDLIRNIRTSSSPCIIRFQAGTLISSQHKRKLRSLELCPVNDHLFVTSALDGIVNLWQLQGKGSNASLLSSVDCLSPKQRRWPEDLAWHPDGDSIFAAYTADGGESQISVLNLNASRDKKVTFLDRKPHHKGIINSIMFMPWDDIYFSSGGSDHAVVLWQETDDSWKPKTIHGTLHSSAVMGVAGLYQKKTILSAGADKRVIAYDLLAGRSEFKNQIESKCMSVLPNPSDFNLFMVQTGEPGKQLRLFDVRLRQTEIHAFGWKQETSESQSALINQAWSPDGLYLSSGSADPVIHIFDIRRDGRSPSQSVQAHQKRVFKAVWHQSLPLLTSISSDLNIGLHKRW
ncbi:U5 small nuclear ribonucleoprotein 40 kDa protein [Canna indica]|uniref:U5 small nuclear ribonucleoprotein 40 kDa protein n=1 Tax=Canna indica TaxID=4628 RepID=A0AAQ3QCX7_9LILI|nr:U5 small nuclear ribonucleoprotein 40 kDa protein [Canna indica]